MKIKDGFMLSNIAGNSVVIPTGENVVNFNAMMTLNETGAFLWNLLQEDCTKDALVGSMTSEYDVDKETAEKDVSDFIALLEKENLLEK